MTSREVLEAAIDIATRNGWQLHESVPQHMVAIRTMTDHRIYWELILDSAGKTQGISESSVYGLIFSHDFVRALWPGKIEVYRSSDDVSDFYDKVAAWQYYLQQMVIADDPVKYMGENI